MGFAEKKKSKTNKHKTPQKPNQTKKQKSNSKGVASRQCTLFVVTRNESACEAPWYSRKHEHACELMTKQLSKTECHNWKHGCHMSTWYRPGKMQWCCVFFRNTFESEPSPHNRAPLYHSFPSHPGDVIQCRGSVISFNLHDEPPSNCCFSLSSFPNEQSSNASAQTSYSLQLSILEVSVQAACLCMWEPVSKFNHGTVSSTEHPLSKSSSRYKIKASQKRPSFGE